MNRDLLGFVRNSLDARHAPLTEVAKGSGVPYETLKKIASGATPNPGVRHVQALADYFDDLSAGEGAKAQVRELLVRPAAEKSAEPELVDSQPNTAPAPAQQTPAVINSEALHTGQEVVHG